MTLKAGPTSSPAPPRNGGEGPLVLVADDDDHILELLSFYLGKAGYRVATARDGDATLAMERDLRPALLVVDIMMPGPDGLQVCRALRQRGNVPIILLTARSSDIDKIAGLRLGADDYVTKPFNPDELLARIEAVLRRAAIGGLGASISVQLGKLSLDPAARVVTVGGVPIALTPREFDLLATLVRFPGIVLGREQLLDLVWGTAFYAMRTVDVHVARLREKLQASGVRIETVWGNGYRLVEES